MEVIKCPNPKCRRRILDDEGTETEWTVLEIKCQHCGKLVRLYCCCYPFCLTYNYAGCLSQN